MIVNKSKQGLHIILHEAHGLLAGKIADEIKPEFRPINWFETLIAVCEHDDRQLNFDEKDYLSDIGVPLDFTEEKMYAENVIERMLRIMKSSLNKSLWVRLLISYHLEFIYSDLLKTSKQMAEVLQEEKLFRKKILKEYKISNFKAREYYEFLRFCDRLSLILCKDETPTAGRLLEINTSINQTQYFIKKDENDVLRVSPWIFKTDEFKLSIEERLLSQTQFNSSKQFEKVLLNTLPVLKKWTIAK
ncbi:MAG: DUF3891 family protein [Gelidibacter sp.]